MVKELGLSLSHASLSNKVFDYIKEQIINGRYNPGESLLESKLAKEMGVSRTPIREAIRLLVLEGLVEMIPNKGAVVLGISTKDVEDIFAIRILVERLAARWATDRMASADKKELKKIIELMEFYAQKGDLDEVAKLDMKFHQIIYESSGSKILNKLLSNLYQYVQVARLESLRVPERIIKTMAEHQAILESFLESDPDAAEEMLTDHVQKVFLNIKGTKMF